MDMLLTTTPIVIGLLPRHKVRLFLLHKDVGMCEGIPYLYVCGNHDAFVMIQTGCDKFGMFKEEQV